MTCPKHDVLLAYHIGQLDEAAAGEVIPHISACPNCQADLKTFGDTDDTLVARLRGPAAEDPYAAEPQQAELAARAKAIVITKAWASEVPAPASGPAGLGRLGEYELLAKLGEGGMGAVYKARQTKLKKIVALKVLPKERTNDPQAHTRFEREMEAVGRVDHPNIVRAMDAREIDGTTVLVMEYVEGLDLAEVVKRAGPLPVAEACEMVRQAAEGLQCAYESSLVHRDIKPSNLMLTRRGQVKILDLGLALLPSGQANVEMTGSGQIMGTADYIAPEQAFDTHNVDIRADIYSLGCTLYKLLTGHAPFSGPEYENPMKKMLAHVQTPVPPVTGARSDIPKGLVAVLDRMLAKAPADRFATPAEVAAALEPFTAGRDLARLIGRSDAGPEAAREAAESSGKTNQSVGSPSIDPRPSNTPDGTAATPEGLPGAGGRTAGPGEAAPLRTLPRPVCRKPYWVAAALGLVILAVAAFGIVIRIRDNRNRETALDVPDKSEVKVHPDGSVDVILPPGKTQENRPDKTEATVTPEGSASPVPAKPNPQARKPSEPLSAMALVTRPAGLPGVRSWTIDTAAHHSGILAVAYHPGGQWLASGGCDGAVRLWPQGSGPARLLVGHHGPVQSLAWSPDGSLLASGGWDATIRLWDPRTGRLRWSHVRNAAFSWWIIEIAWSPDGTRLAFGTFDGAAEVLDMRSGRTLRALGYCEHSVCSMAWSPDGKTLAWGGYNEDIRISDVGSGNEVRRLPQQGKTFFQALAWSADGASLTSLSSDGTVRLWDIRTGKTIRQFPTVPFLGWTCNRWLSHDAKRLAMNDAGASRTEIWDATSGQRLLSLDPAGSIPYALDWSPDGRTMANGTVYGFIHFWDVRSGKLSRTLDGSTGYMRGPTAWSPDGKALVGSPEDSRLCVWDMASGRQVRRLPVNHGTSAAAWSPDAAQIAGADSGNSIFVWEAGWGKLVHKLQGHAAAVRTLTWAPHGDRLASGDERGGVMLWDTSSGKPWKTLRQGGSGPEIRFLAWSPDAQRLAVNGLGNKVEVWEAQSGRIVQSVPLDTPPLSAAWSPDGKTLACSRQDARNVLLWDAAKGAPKGIVEAGIVARAMTWRPDGNSLVLADFARIEQYDPRLCVRLSTAGVALPTFRRYHPNQLQVGDDWDVRQDEFSPDARHYASAGRDGAIRLIDTSTGHTVRTMLHLPASEHLTVSREGHYLGSPDVEKRLVYVVLTDDGEQLTLTPDEFTRRYGWKNDPAKVILLGEVAPPTANESQTQQQPAAPVKK